MDIAVDFDGTCVSHEYPNVGKDIGAIPILKQLVSNGHRLILFTMRSFATGISPVTKQIEDGGLYDAIKWFEVNGIELYGIQNNPTQKNWTTSPKCYAQLYIDDAALGCPLVNYENGELLDRPYVDWSKVESMLYELKILK